MSGTQPSNDTATEPAGAVALPTRLEVVVVPVADVEARQELLRDSWNVAAASACGTWP